MADEFYIDRLMTPIGELIVIADGQGKRQRIFHDDRVTTNVGFFADATKLMHAGIGADVCAIFDHDVTG